MTPTPEGPVARRDERVQPFVYDANDPLERRVSDLGREARRRGEADAEWSEPEAEAMQRAMHERWIAPQASMADAARRAITGTANTGGEPEPTGGTT